MKSNNKKNFFLLVLLFTAFQFTQAQENRFNSELDKFCKTSIKEFKNISKERKVVLDEMANQLARKKYVVFTCKTNSRRTLMLQVWAQTAFYYYSILGKYAFSIGDTITDVYPGVAEVLTEAGFFCTYQRNVEPGGYIISISKEYPLNMLSSKNKVGTIDTAKGVLVNICFDANEQSTIAAGKGHINLPFQSPTQAENTSKEKETYHGLNQQIATEMLYLAKKTKASINELMNDVE